MHLRWVSGLLIAMLVLSALAAQSQSADQRKIRGYLKDLDRRPNTDGSGKQ